MEGITPACSYPIHLLLSYTLSKLCAKWDHSTIAHTCCIFDCSDIKCSCTGAHITSSLWPWECDLCIASLPKLPQKSTAVVLMRNGPSVSGFKQISWSSKNMLWNSSLWPYFPLKGSIHNLHDWDHLNITSCFCWHLAILTSRQNTTEMYMEITQPVKNLDRNPSCHMRNIEDYGYPRHLLSYTSLILS